MKFIILSLWIFFIINIILIGYVSGDSLYIVLGLLLFGVSFDELYTEFIKKHK